MGGLERALPTNECIFHGEGEMEGKAERGRRKATTHEYEMSQWLCLGKTLFIRGCPPLSSSL